jgi:hypothetical protein
MYSFQEFSQYLEDNNYFLRIHVAHPNPKSSLKRNTS